MPFGALDPDWAPTLIKDWNFTPTRQGTYFKKALLKSPRSPEAALVN